MSPCKVAVAPIYNDAGDIIGGVETFRDASEMVHDLERAKAIQHIALHHDAPEDERISFTTHYVPHAIVGGDFYAIQKLDADRYAVMLADVMGHGVAAALYTMHLSQLWERYHKQADHPAAFTAKINDELAKVVKTDESFATAVCGLVDLTNRSFRFAGAGGPQVLLMHRDGAYECLESSGLPLAVMEGAEYEETTVELVAGDRLLLFSDGAIEIHNSEGQMLEVEGLVSLLLKQGYPETDIKMDALEEELLKYSNSIRLDDDLTLMEVHFVA